MTITDFDPYNTNIYNYLSLIIDRYKDIDFKTSDEDPYEALERLFKLRHDCVHLFVEAVITDTIMRPKFGAIEYTIKKSLIESQTLYNKLTMDGTDNLIMKDINKTPDLIIVRDHHSNDKCWKVLQEYTTDIASKLYGADNQLEVYSNLDVVIIDFSVSTSRNKNIIQKNEKYKNITEGFKRIFNTSKFVVFSVSVSMSNLNQELENLQSTIGFQFDIRSTYMGISTLLDSVESTMTSVKQQIGDQRSIGMFMNRKFGENEGLNFHDKLISTNSNNRNIIEEMYCKHMSYDNKGKRSMIDEMGDDQTTLTDDDIAIKLKPILESNDTDFMMEKKSSHEVIQRSIDEINDKIDKNQTNKIKPSIHTFIPLTHYIIPNQSNNNNGKMKTEQVQIVNMLNLFSTMNNTGIDFIDGLKEFSEHVVDCFNGSAKAYNESIFSDDVIINEDINKIIRDKYESYKSQTKNKKHGFESKLEFIRANKDAISDTIPETCPEYKDWYDSIPGDEDCRAFKQKMVRINMNKATPKLKEFLKMNQSGLKLIREYKPYSQASVDPSCYKEIDNYLDYVSTKNNTPPQLFRNPEIISDKFILDSLENFSSTDAEIVTQFKQRNTQDIMSIINTVRDYPAYWYSLNQFLVAEQLCHFTQFTLPTNTFSLFTCGSPNVCFLVQNSYHDSGNDVGKAFLSFGYTDKDEEINDIFGKIYTTRKEINGKQLIFFSTNWRRLTSTKTTFTRDQFFSTLSTATNALLRARDDLNIESISNGLNKTIRHHYALKAIVGFSTNQRTAELLADMRYAIMSAFSEFSRIDKFISDKFQPPFRNAMDMWIYKRLDNIVEFVKNIETHRSNMTFKQPKFVAGKRTEESLGGQVLIPSIWDGYTITELQDILDDLFLYVHTIKEPSSIHYENVKSINTILKYQKLYNSMSDARKMGNILTDEDTIINFLRDNNIIGHSKDIVNLSAKYTLDNVNKTMLDDFFTEVLNEPLSNITSTKAAIPEYKRAVTLQKVSRKKIQQIRNKLQDTIKSGTVGVDMDDIIRKMMLQHKSDDKNYYKQSNDLYAVKKKTGIGSENNLRHMENLNMSEQQREFLGVTMDDECIRSLTKQISVIPSDSHLPDGIRAKVHDCLLDFITRNPEAQSVLHLARWNVMHKESLVHADICIKAQYGAKREFYVINIGAKAMARLLEEYFHKICNLMPNEMISVPGDRKLLNMQSMINDVMSQKRYTHSIYYTNGDCTKWSAAETMECFHSLIVGMKDRIPEHAFKMCKMVIRSWGMKKINIPLSILTNTYKIKQDLTGYLSNCTDAQLDSTQNFLQGMFNYMSSFKAVCCSNYTMRIWNKMYPESDLRMQHLEHSDDYVLMISVKTDEEMLRFRKFHRIMMKMHGFNDSEKKTNTQKLLMEFISLASLNGHMTYPQIKKTKEVGLNLGCTGYRDDIDMAVSRVAEAVRIGTAMDAAYAMQKIHIANVYRSYSLFEGQRNSIWNSKMMFEMPVEVFGMPDMHPIMGMMAKGNPNNYRLYNYGIQQQKDIIETLFSMEVINTEELSKVEDTDINENMRLYHPRYTFAKEGKTVKKIREKLNLEYEDIENFWDKHKSYNFIKPISSKNLTDWMKAMYFKSNFTLAYSRNSRAQITLRLSTYTSKMCIINPLDESSILYSDQSNIEDNGQNLKNGMIAPCTIKKYIEWVTVQNSKKYIIKAKEIVERETSIEFKVLLARTLCNCDSTIDALYNMMENSRLSESDKDKLPTVAMLTPNKLLWVSTDSNPTTLLQYIFNPDDLIEDMRAIKSHKSLEADREAIVKHYKAEIGEESPLSTVKTVFQDIIMSQQRRNLCMSYMNTNNNLDDFFKKHIEYGLSTSSNYDMHTRGIIKAVNPHSGLTYFKKNIDLTKEEIRLMIDDSTLLYVLLKHGYNMELSNIVSIMKSLRFKMGSYRNENCDRKFEDMMNSDLQQLQSIGCNNNELKRFIYLKSVIAGDMSDMYTYLDSTFAYKYEYTPLIKSSRENIKDQVFFEYMNCGFLGIKSATGEICVVADNKVRTGIVNSYIICLKLFGHIKMSDLEYLIANPMRSNMDNIMHKYRPRTTGLRVEISQNIEISSAIYITSKGTEIIPIQSKEYNDYLNVYGEPLIYTGSLPLNTAFLKEQQITKRAEIIESRSEVRTGTSKIFSLPYLDCNQSNLCYTSDEYNLEGLSTNWWLDMSRIRNYLQKGEVDIKQSDVCKYGKHMKEVSNIQMDINSAKIIRNMKHFPRIESLKTTKQELSLIQGNFNFEPSDLVFGGGTDNTMDQVTTMNPEDDSNEIQRKLLKDIMQDILSRQLKLCTYINLDEPTPDNIGLSDRIYMIIIRELMSELGTKMDIEGPYKHITIDTNMDEYIREALLSNGTTIIYRDNIRSILLNCMMMSDPESFSEYDWTEGLEKDVNDFYNNIQEVEATTTYLINGFSRSRLDYVCSDTTIETDIGSLKDAGFDTTPIIDGLIEWMKDRILSTSTPTLICHEDEIRDFMNEVVEMSRVIQEQYSKKLLDMNNYMKELLPNVQEVQDIVTIYDLDDFPSLQILMGSEGIKAATMDEVMGLIIRGIHIQNEGFEVTNDIVQMGISNILNERSPNEIPSITQLIAIRGSAREKITANDIVPDQELVESIGKIKSIISMLANNNNIELADLSYLSMPMEQIDFQIGIEDLEPHDSTRDDAPIMGRPKITYKMYKNLKDKLTICGIVWNDFSEELIVRWNTIDDLSKGDLHRQIIESMTNGNRNIVKFRFATLERTIRDMLSGTEEQMISSIAEGELDITSGTIDSMSESGSISCTFRLSVVTDIGIVNIQDERHMMELLSIDIIQNPQKIMDTITNIKKEYEKSGFFSNEEYMMKWNEKHGEHLEWNQVKGLSKMEIEGLTLRNTMPTGTFELMPLEEDDQEYEINFEINDDILSASGSSKDSEEYMDRQINYHQLALMEPIIQKKVVITGLNAPYNISQIMGKGNPTTYIINKYIMPDSSIKATDPLIILMYLQKIRYIMNDHSKVTNQEHQLLIAIGNKIVEFLTVKERISISEDIVMYPDTNGIRLYYEIEDVYDQDFKNSAISDGGHILNGSIISGNSQTVCVPLLDDDIEELVQPIRKSVDSLKTYTEFQLVDELFDRAYGRQGGRMNKLRKRFGLKFVPV
jgi:hypothetical protein